MGFNVAFALTNFDGSNDIVADPDYGTMVARMVSWGTSEEDQNQLLYTYLDTHQCTYDELGLNDQDLVKKVELTEAEEDSES